LLQVPSPQDTQVPQSIAHDAQSSPLVHHPSPQVVQSPGHDQTLSPLLQLPSPQ
jgi:hypothetical protein